MKQKLINWLLDKLEGKRTIKIYESPQLPRSLALIDGNAENIGIAKVSYAGVDDVKQDKVDLVVPVAVVDPIADAGKMLEDDSDSCVRSVEGDAGFTAVGIGHGIILENVKRMHR